MLQDDMGRLNLMYLALLELSVSENAWYISIDFSKLMKSFYSIVFNDNAKKSISKMSSYFFLSRTMYWKMQVDILVEIFDFLLQCVTVDSQVFHIFSPSKESLNMKKSIFWLPSVAGRILWDKVFKSGLSKFCGRQPLKNLKGYDLLKQTISLQIF